MLVHSCPVVAINVALEKHRKIDSLSQPMSQREGFAYIEVRALAFCAPRSLYIGNDTKEGDPRWEGGEKGAGLDYPSPIGTFSIDCCTLSVIFDTSGNRREHSPSRLGFP